MRTTVQLKPRKPMKKIGRVGKATIASNKAFLASIPDSELYCFYCLAIGIKRLLTRQEARAEHFYSRARHPEFRLDKSKLVISCDPHNEKKGSMDGDEFIEKLKGQHEQANSHKATEQ